MHVPMPKSIQSYNTTLLKVNLHFGTYNIWISFHAERERHSVEKVPNVYSGNDMNIAGMELVWLNLL